MLLPSLPLQLLLSLLCGDHGFLAWDFISVCFWNSQQNLVCVFTAWQLHESPTVGAVVVYLWCSWFTDIFWKRSRTILNHVDIFWFKQGGRWDSLQFLGGFSAPTLPTLWQKTSITAISRCPFNLYAGVKSTNYSPWTSLAVSGYHCLVTTVVLVNCGCTVGSLTFLIWIDRAGCCSGHWHFGFFPSVTSREKVEVRIQQSLQFRQCTCCDVFSGHVFWTDSVMGPRSTLNR